MARQPVDGLWLCFTEKSQELSCSFYTAAVKKNNKLYWADEF